MKIKLNEEEYLHLKASDETLSKLMDKWGILEINTTDNLFEFIIREIIEQMLSIKAAECIFNRLKNIVNEITPNSISNLTQEEIKAIGTSTKKAEYIKAFAEDVLFNRFNIDRLKTLNDEELIKSLTSIKGIGVWTAEMVACFGLGRKDIWSFNDVAIKNGILKANPKFKTISRQRFDKIGNRYRPYRSFAALYYYQENDN